MRLTDLQTEMLRALDQRPYRRYELERKYRMYDNKEAVGAHLAKLACFELVDIEEDCYAISDKGADYLKAKPNVVPPRMYTNAATRETLKAIVMTPVRADPSRNLKSLSWSPDRERQKPQEIVTHGPGSVRQPSPMLA